MTVEKNFHEIKNNINELCSIMWNYRNLSYDDLYKYIKLYLLHNDITRNILLKSSHLFTGTIIKVCSEIRDKVSNEYIIELILRSKADFYSPDCINYLKTIDNHIIQKFIKSKMDICNILLYPDGVSFDLSKCTPEQINCIILNLICLDYDVAKYYEQLLIPGNKYYFLNINLKNSSLSLEAKNDVIFNNIEEIILFLG